MSNVRWLKTARLLCALCAATARISQAQTFTTLHSFAGYPTEGSLSEAALIQGRDGNFYGTTFEGGAYDQGTVFKMTPAPVGMLTTLYSFCSQNNGAFCSDGEYATSGLVEGIDGNFYGTTLSGGGTSGGGTVFKIDSFGDLTTLYNFCAKGPQGNYTCPDGASPVGLILGTDGNFYGATSVGGTGPGCGDGGCGTLFEITSDGTLTTLYIFCPQYGCTDGSHPEAAPVEGTDGNFYGTTESGGAYGGGTVFKITPGPVDTLTTLYSFCSQGGSSCTDGSQPSAPPLEGSDENFYGTTDFGGANGHGTVYEITAAGALTTLYSFCSQGGSSCTDGDANYSGAGLVEGSVGNFYGTTPNGGANGEGTVFMITPVLKTFNTVYNFCSQGGSSCTDGAAPGVGLVEGIDTNLYGTTDLGGAFGYGTVFVLLSSHPVASVAPNTLTFAGQGVGTTSALQPVTLSNLGQVALSVSSITISGDFAESNNCNGSVAASGSCAINVTFTPTASGTRTGTLTISDNSGGTTGSTLTVTLSGTGTAPVAGVSPGSLSFGNQLQGTTSTAQSVTLSNTGSAALTITSVTSSGNFAETNTCGSSVAANGSCTISVTFTPQSTGMLTGSLIITDNSRGTTGSTQTVTLSGTGTVPVAGVSPGSLNFGNQLQGTTSAAQTVTLSNTGSAALTITSISTTGNFAETNTCGSSLAAGSNCAISVTFTPQANGLLTGSLTITDNSNGVAGSQQTVNLSGTGVLLAPPSGNGCNGVYMGTFQGDLNVSSGQNCVFVSGGPTGNVTETSGNLVLSNASIGNNVTVNGGGTFSIGPSTTIKGNLQIQSIPTGSATNQVCATNVGGNLQFQNNGTAVLIGSSSSSCAGNVIKGNLEVHNNTAATTMYGNTVGGNLQDQNNTASTQVFTNSITQNLQCQSNTSIAGGGNTAASKQGQCVGF